MRRQLTRQNYQLVGKVWEDRKIRGIEVSLVLMDNLIYSKTLWSS